MIFTLVAGAAWAAQPQWTSIATPADAYQYFKYGNAQRTELAKFDPKNAHPPMSYGFAKGPAPARTVCPLENRDGVYWFAPDGKDLSGTLTTPNPTVFNVSPLEKGIRGFAVTADFGGAAARTGAVEVAYFTDRACSDGGTEYGFSRDLATDSILVYWSTYANCANDAASLCRKANDPSLGKNFSNVQQENGGIQSQHGFRIYHLDPGAHTFQISVERREFGVEVRTGSKLAQCSTEPQGAIGTCSIHQPVEPWFPIDQLPSGYIVTGTQTVGDPGIAAGSKFVVSDILVAK